MLGAGHACNFVRMLASTFMTKQHTKFAAPDKERTFVSLVGLRFWTHGGFDDLFRRSQPRVQLPCSFAFLWEAFFLAAFGSCIATTCCTA